MAQSDHCFETIGKLQIDRAFRPDISLRGVDADVLSLMGCYGMQTVGTPVLGLPAKRYALWFGTVPSKHNEVPVVLAGSTKPLLDFDTEWSCGIAEAANRILLPDSQTLEIYSAEAIEPATSPENAIVRAISLVDGVDAIPKNLRDKIRD